MFFIELKGDKGKLILKYTKKETRPFWAGSLFNNKSQGFFKVSFFILEVSFLCFLVVSCLIVPAFATNVPKVNVEIINAAKNFFIRLNFSVN